MKGTYWASRQKQGKFDFAQDVHFDDYHQITWLIGDFFEFMGTKIIGGKTKLYDKMRAHERGTKVPDLVDWDKDMAFEVKGCSWGRSFKISSIQLSNYRKMTNESFPLDCPTIYYVLFAYQLPTKLKEYGTELNLIKALAKSIRFAVVLPLELVEVFDRICPHVIWKRDWDYQGSRELELANIKMQHIWDLQICTEQKLAELALEVEDLDFNFDYECENFWSKAFRVCQFGISRFPITEIRSRGERICQRKIQNHSQ